MTEEQEQMLWTVLRNQEVIMNALAEIFTGSPDSASEENRRDKTLTDLGTCVGLTHYYLKDLRQLEEFRRSQRQTKN